MNRAITMTDEELAAMAAGKGAPAEAAPLADRVAAYMAEGQGRAVRAVAERLVLGGEPDPDAYPRDMNTVGKLARFLTAFPELRPRLGEMAEVSGPWSRLVEVWGWLEHGYAREWGGPEPKAPPAPAPGEERVPAWSPAGSGVERLLSHVLPAGETFLG